MHNAARCENNTRATDDSRFDGAGSIVVAPTGRYKGSSVMSSGAHAWGTNTSVVHSHVLPHTQQAKQRAGTEAANREIVREKERERERGEEGERERERDVGGACNVHA